MPDWLHIVLAIAAGIVLVGGVFWFTFANKPGKRPDGGLSQHDAGRYFGGDDRGGA